MPASPAGHPDPVLTAHLSRYSSYLRAAGYRPTTRRLLFGVVADLCAAQQVAPDLIDPAAVERFLERDLAPATRRSYLWALRLHAAWCGRPDPTAGMRRPRVGYGVPKPVSEADLAVLLEAARGRTRCYLLLGAFCGLRSFETAKVAGVDLERRQAGTVLRVEGKGGRVDLVPLPGHVEAEMRPWVLGAGGGRLWPTASANSVQQAIRRLGGQTGIPVTSHMLRHRYGTALWLASRDLLTVQRLMRHAVPATTAGYVLVADDAGRALVDALPRPGLRAV